MYKEIVERTNANRKNYQANEQVAGNVGIKYKSIIKPLSNQPTLLTVQNKFNKPSPPPATSSSRTRSGSIDTSKPGSVPMSRARSGTLPTTSAEKSKASIKTKASSSSSSPAKSKGGKGLRTLEVTNKNIEYVPWNNPNKLVDRLRLLISSQLAGNTSHSNEINLKKFVSHCLGLVYKSMRGMMTNSIDRDQWLNVTSESRDRIWPFFYYYLNFALGRNRTRDPRVPEPKRTPLGYILPNH
jgi:hypothetical protein